MAIERRQYQITTENQVSAFAGSLDDDQLWCRTTGHNWVFRERELVSVEGSRKRYEEWRYTCRCGSQRTDVIEVDTGHKLFQWISYVGSPGYLAKGISRFPGDFKGVLRKEIQTRI